MTHFRTWQWSFDNEDASVSCFPDGVTWSADMAYYPGKPSQPSCHQSFAAFLAEGVPEGYESVPEVILLELQETARWAQARQKENTGERHED